VRVRQRGAYIYSSLRSGTPVQVDPSSP